MILGVGLKKSMASIVNFEINKNPNTIIKSGFQNMVSKRLPDSSVWRGLTFHLI
jgi:hypothetical protein